MSRGGDGGCGCYLVFLAALLGIWAFDRITTPEPSHAAKTVPQPVDTSAVIQWQPQGSTCADGWSSSSIGRRGACSHHGGVVSVWRDSSGRQVTCRGFPPLTVNQLWAATDQSGHVRC